MKKIIIGVIIGIVICIGTLGLLSIIKKNIMNNKNDDVIYNYSYIQEYENVMNNNKNILNNINPENLNCVNSIKEFITESEKTYFVGDINLKDEVTAYFDSYSNKMNLLYEKINNSCILKEETKNIVTLFMQTNNLISSKVYFNYISRGNVNSNSKEPETNQLSRKVLKMNEARLIELIIKDIYK